MRCCSMEGEAIVDTPVTEWKQKDCCIFLLAIRVSEVTGRTAHSSPSN